MFRQVALIVGVLTAAICSAEVGNDVTVISFGRADQMAQGRAFYGPFVKSTGVNIKPYSYDGQLDDLRAMVSAGKTSWDVMEVESSALNMGCKDGLFEKLDIAKIGKRSDFVPGSVSDCGIGLLAWSMAMTYNADAVQGTPRSWADFWNVKKFPGKRGLRRSAKYTLEIALLADGVAPEDVYRVLGSKWGVNRAFRKLEELKPNIVWWEAAEQPPLFMARGDMVMSSAFVSRVEDARRQGNHFKIVWNQSLYDFDSWAIPKGTPNVENAYKFIAFATQADSQKAYTEILPFGPTNVHAVGLLDAPLARDLPTAPANFDGAFKVNVDFWLEHGGDLERRFADWAPPPHRQQTEEDEDVESFTHQDKH